MTQLPGTTPCGGDPTVIVEGREIPQEGRHRSPPERVIEVIAGSVDGPVTPVRLAVCRNLPDLGFVAEFVR